MDKNKIDIDIREYVNERIATELASIHIDIGHIDRATRLFHENLTQRFASTNEWREAMNDREANFVTKSEHKFLCDDISLLKEHKARLEGMASQRSVMIAFIIAFMGLLIGILNFFK